MNEAQHIDLTHRIDKLRLEHRALDEELENLSHDLLTDDLQMQRLKKRKLFLKDSINHLEHKLAPDLSA